VRAVLALTGEQVPWEIAEKLPHWKLLALNVAAGEVHGGNFDWNAMRWLDRT
jgi:hypothetical protein